MFKNSYLSILKLNRFEFGDQTVSQFVIFECKYLFSIIIFYFHKSDGCQDRFHTHAFNALSIKIFGNYTEEILVDENNYKTITNPTRPIIKYFPRNSYHRICKSNGCMTILFSGPWKRTWKEYINGEVIEYSWSRELKTEKQ